MTVSQFKMISLKSLIESVSDCATNIRGGKLVRLSCLFNKDFQIFVTNANLY